MSDGPRSFDLFTDGACMGNPGKGGWAFILRDLASGEEVRESGAEAHTTNNRMEMTSVIRGLEQVAEPARIRLVTDSQYVTKGISEWMKGWKARGWKRLVNGKLEPVANVELWQELDGQLQRHKVSCQWVRGHAGHAENEECDQMAVAAYQNLGSSRSSSSKSSTRTAPTPATTLSMRDFGRATIYSQGDLEAVARLLMAACSAGAAASNRLTVGDVVAAYDRLVGSTSAGSVAAAAHKLGLDPAAVLVDD